MHGSVGDRGARSDARSGQPDARETRVHRFKRFARSLGPEKRPGSETSRKQGHNASSQLLAHAKEGAIRLGSIAKPSNLCTWGQKSMRNRIKTQPKPRCPNRVPAPKTRMAGILVITAQIKERTKREGRQLSYNCGNHHTTHLSNKMPLINVAVRRLAFRAS